MKMNKDESVISDFRRWLEAKKYARSTVKEYLRTISKVDYLKEMRYEDLINYLSKLQGNVQPQTIKRRLSSIRVYYDYLLEKGEVNRNIARNLDVKNERKVLVPLLKEEELERLYESYKVSTYYELRKKVLLGLVIYQGVDLTTVQLLREEDINLEKGEIYLPSTRRSNSRRISLKGCQMLPIHRYIEVHKGREIIKADESLLFRGRVGNVYHDLLKELRKGNRKVESIRQLRRSVITNWLGRYNLREVQYYCGHRYISSTEKYKRVDMEQLKSDMKKYHLFGGN